MQVQAQKLIKPSELDFNKIKELATNIEQVYNFERDVTVAKVTDPEFDKTVKNINNYMTKYRGTFQDANYLREPSKTIEE